MLFSMLVFRTFSRLGKLAGAERPTQSAGGSINNSIINIIIIVIVIIII